LATWVVITITAVPGGRHVAEPSASQNRSSRSERDRNDPIGRTQPDHLARTQQGSVSAGCDRTHGAVYGSP